MPASVDSMFSVREMPWHHQGVILNDYPGTWEEARIPAGLTWEPDTEPVYQLDGMDADGKPTYKLTEGYQRIYRNDTNATLAVRQDSYEVISNGEMGRIVEAVLAQPGVKWETAGSLEGGRSVWCLAYLDEPIKVFGDSSLTMPYLAMTNRHGAGSGPASCALRATAIRIVCANTFHAAEVEGEKHGATFSFAHRGNWEDHIEEARNAVTGARREFAAYADLAGDLLAIPVTPKQRELFVREFIPAPPDGLASDRTLNNVEEARKAVRQILDSPTTAEVAHTVYGLMQAGGEYADHVRASRSWETKLNRSLLRPEPLKRRALSIARQVATADV